MSSSKTVTWAAPLPSANYRIQVTQVYNSVSNTWTTHANMSTPPAAGFNMNGFGYSVGGYASNLLPYRERIITGCPSDIERAMPDVIVPFMQTFHKLTGVGFPLDWYVAHSDTSASSLVIEFGHARKPERMDDGDQR